MDIRGKKTGEGPEFVRIRIKLPRHTGLHNGAETFVVETQGLGSRCETAKSVILLFTSHPIMCRWIVYAGVPILIADILILPRYVRS